MAVSLLLFFIYRKGVIQLIYYLKRFWQNSGVHDLLMLGTEENIAFWQKAYIILMGWDAV